MNQPGAQVAVVGAGVAGLTVAFQLQQSAPHLQVTVVDSADRAGGLVHTETHGRFVIEHGPEAILSSKPAALTLSERLGLNHRIIRTRPENRGAYIAHQGHLTRIPRGFSIMAPLQWPPFLASPVLTWRGKYRALAERVIPGRPYGHGEPEESAQHFVERRFGRELFERLAEPLLSGIYGADPRELSLAATMPRFVQAERNFGSVTRGLQADMHRPGQRRDTGGARYGMFFAFDGGVQVLTRELTQRLSGPIHLSTPVQGVQRTPHGWRLLTDDPAAFAEPFHTLVLATPPPASARLLQHATPQLSRELSRITMGSLAAVTFAFHEHQIHRPLDASGFVVPVREGRPVLACTWSSRKWSHRAPDQYELIRVFMGGHGRPEAWRWGDDRLVRQAAQELRQLVPFSGHPLFHRVHRWVHALPQRTLGHLDREQRIQHDQRQYRNLHVVNLGHAGIPDAITAALRVAEGILTP